VVWAVLWLATDAILEGFSVAGPGIEVVRAFTAYGAGAWLFSGWLFVSNAAFNNLGHPIWSTGFNWSRDAVAIPLLAALTGAGMLALGPASAVMVQAMAALLVGVAAVVAAGRFVSRGLAPPAPGTPPVAPMPALSPFGSGRAALAQHAQERSPDAPHPDASREDPLPRS
ncbi:MAG: hypothetical protein AAFV49_10135, partial [Pseudomonadota bacterium]